ncbi:MAG TPA: hypothetical protein VLF18_12605 [Tahibacter sp.]|uniref:hypothetical protein n=1 Tax=Tahibacter sp. TaxID=2056211 RepID=UPI002BA25454|nr:hypothetical protein [Tahibacter sp.]HSX61036.1 hypothetical protein [Tahibacter sp.]
MPDILVRHIDDILADRIKEIAREHQWSINEAILFALRRGVGLTGEDMHRELHDIAMLSGTWESTETAAFRAALEAFERVSGKPLFTDDAIENQEPK